MRKVFVLLAGLLIAVAAGAEDWPMKPVRLIVPYPPGGGTDVVARIKPEPIGPVALLPGGGFTRLAVTASRRQAFQGGLELSPLELDG